LFVFPELVIEPVASCILRKVLSTELHPSPMLVSWVQKIPFILFSQKGKKEKLGAGGSRL
jgi:hypothetical protein